jgi:hypothetical protein
MAEFFVNGIVSRRDHQPYIQLSNEKGMIAQLSMAQARIIAMDILVMCSRTEMDAMLRRFCVEKLNLPAEAPDGMVMTFRDYRAELDQEKVERSMTDPDTGETK